MITKKTLFILGAGASVPYGYPTGRQLRKEIYTHFQNDIMEVGCIGSTVEKNLCNDLQQQFFNSGNDSIDSFLAKNENNKPFVELGKKAIVLRILNAEQKSRFYEKSFFPEQDWFTYLFNEMTNELNDAKGYERFRDNSVSFITFNYDRSLEYLLYNCLTNSYSDMKSREHDISELIPFPIIHVYGKVADLPWESACERNPRNKLDYRKIPDWQIQLNIFKNNIKIIKERISNGDEIENAKKKIEEASRIYFLGFGFAKENLDILEIPKKVTDDKEIYGTAFGMTDKEIKRVRNLLQQNFKIEDAGKNSLNNPIVKNKNCLELLREYL